MAQARFCMECGNELPEEAKFCPSCGTQVAAPPEPAEPEEAAPEAPPIPAELRERYETARKELRGDRREVVVLFADVVGFTSMAESMDAEDVSMTMQGWLGELSEVVYRYEGYVDKYIGDAIMALFGAPVAHEDDPERAVHAALEMESAAEKWGGGGPDSPTLRIGLNLGDVVAAHLGDDQRMQYTAMGDAVNVASRLESEAEPGTVLISDPLKRRVEGAFETSEVEPLQVKGKSRPLKAHRVVARRAVREAKRGPSETPFVDREQELAAIGSLLSGLGEPRTQEAEAAPALLVEGDTGTGKSRLMREALARAGGEVRTIETFFSPFALPGALSPATELFRRVAAGEAASATGDGAPTGGAALVDRALELLGEDADDHRPGVLGLALQADPEADVEAPPEIDPERARQNRWLALAALLSRASEAEQPIALVFEDLHWAEEAARELIAFLLSSLARSRAGLLLTTRAVGEEDWLPESVDRLPLEPLEDEDAKALLGDIYRELPLEVRRDLLSRSQGNPLYLVELSSALSESVEDPAEAAVPGSLQAILRSRIDRLSGPVEYLLQMAAVLGIRFPTALLERMYGLEPRTMTFEASLNVLEDSGFLEPAEDGGEQAHRFRHTLARDVTYNGLLRRVRKVLHESAATLGEEHFEERIAEQAPFFAHHYWEAG
ncbi:MAG: adenylate/guanylate cyclase domain-containing protein, partial [Gemmatimonadota bacterium]|nr:adenylate/guanylate cyclase domain-containing protein [Gemmatimonadota bacterium]